MPFPRTLKPSAEIVRQLHWRLLEERKVYAAHFWHNGAWWVRVSAQIFNEVYEAPSSIHKPWLIKTLLFLRWKILRSWVMHSLKFVVKSSPFQALMGNSSGSLSVNEV
jgi:hypothetical protein